MMLHVIHESNVLATYLSHSYYNGTELQLEHPSQ